MSKLYMNSTIGMVYIIRHKDDTEFLKVFFEESGYFYFKHDVGVLFESLRIQVIKNLNKHIDTI